VRGPAQFDLVIRGGTVVDGSGGKPFVADVGVCNGRIAAVGPSLGSGTQELDAAGLLVTPGFVDIHTHYDGQVTWEQRLDPSSNHGVTTVVMGNCGVGFAPCRARDRKALVRLMEGVEDVPEVVMTEGLPWNWESFPDYLNTLASRRYDVDIAAQLPHAPLRIYVMGERGLAREPAKAEDLIQMTNIAREAIQAGAIGFATSRAIAHTDSAGAPICTLSAAEEELHAIAAGLTQAGSGVIEALFEFTDIETELPLLRRVAERSGRPLSFSLGEVERAPDAWRRALQVLSEARRDGVPLRAQVIGRPTGLLYGLEVSYNPLSYYPTYLSCAHLPLAERVRGLSRPETKAKLLAETPGEPPYPVLKRFFDNFEMMFRLGDPPNYEPAPQTSAAAIARAQGVTPQSVIYDWLLEDGGRALIFQPIANYNEQSLDNTRVMLTDQNTLYGLGDGGAHYGLICDSSMPTFMLTYWTRDRPAGGLLAVEEVVKRLSSDTATHVGLQDRGRIAPGYKADLNVIDYERLTLHAPSVKYDLPGGARRLRQATSGYVATIVSGQITYRDGEPTGALPGVLVRGAQAIPLSS
jgi:N-acyl-D-amino-acid deacylase